MPVHPTAIIEPGAEIDPAAEIGPYCVVGPAAKIGPKTQLLSHVSVQNHTTIGAGNIIYPFASLGAAPQDLKFKGEAARLVIGDNNVVRECTTLNIGTEGGGMETRVGNDCLLMAYTHLAHDCILGNRVILSNGAGLAGHVTIGDYVTFAGQSGIQQFCRVGHHAFIAGAAKVPLDVPPFCIAQGDRAQLVGINVVGLKRAGWDRERINVVREAFKRLFGTGGRRLVALERVEAKLAKDNPDVAEMCAFIREAKRGVCQPRMTDTESFEA